MIVAVYSILLGIAVIGMWTMILVQGGISEGRTEMAFHLFSEFLMAVICIVSGWMLLRNKPKARSFNIFGLGMVTCSVLNAAGYYGDRGNLMMMVFFTGLFILTLISVVIFIDH
jgi:hypothetical protein